MTQGESLQERLLSVLSNSEENMVSSKARNIRPYILNAMQEIRLNQQMKYMPDQLLKEVQRRCVKNAGDNPITNGKIDKLEIDVKDDKSIDELLNRHQKIANEIQARIQHDVELAITQMGIKPAAPQKISAPVEEEDDGDDFYVEEIAEARVIRHK